MVRPNVARVCSITVRSPIYGRLRAAACVRRAPSLRARLRWQLAAALAAHLLHSPHVAGLALLRRRACRAARALPAPRQRLVRQALPALQQAAGRAVRPAALAVRAAVG